MKKLFIAIMILSVLLVGCAGKKAKEVGENQPDINGSPPSSQVSDDKNNESKDKQPNGNEAPDKDPGSEKPDSSVSSGNANTSGKNNSNQAGGGAKDTPKNNGSTNKGSTNKGSTNKGSNDKKDYSGKTDVKQVPKEDANFTLYLVFRDTKVKNLGVNFVLDGKTYVSDKVTSTDNKTYFEYNFKIEVGEHRFIAKTSDGAVREGMFTHSGQKRFAAIDYRLYDGRPGLTFEASDVEIFN